MTDWPVAATADALAAVENAAVLVPRAPRAWRLEGDKAAEALNGLVTNDVLRLAPGDGCYAAALTTKGKIVADMRVFASADHIGVITTQLAGDGWSAMLRKYVNPRLAKWTEITGDLASVTVLGRDAAELISSACGVDAVILRALAPHHRVVESTELAVVRDPRVGVDCFELLGTHAAVESARAALSERGAIIGDEATWEALRIANGWPAWAVEIDDNTLAQEANLDSLGAISFDKGCYIGQETVARVHFRGHVNRNLRRVTFDAADQVPRGAELRDADGKQVGDVRSSAILDGRAVAIAMVRREAAPELVAAWDGHTARVTVLP